MLAVTAEIPLKFQLRDPTSLAVHPKSDSRSTTNGIDQTLDRRQRTADCGTLVRGGSRSIL
jgi:hypothetical protein